MKSSIKRPKISLLHDELPEHLHEYMQLTRLAEMGRMAASIAHEINNPLMIAQGFAENVEMALMQPNPKPEELRIQVVEIVKACQRMSRIINKMNRMSANKKLRLHVVDLAEIALNAVDFVKVQLADLDIQIEFDFNRPMPIKCDIVQVEQMVLNILANAQTALAALDGNRRIRISFEEVGQDWQQIKVWNNGPVIPEKVQARIVSSSFLDDKEDRGGLGLAVSRAIMEAHGGDLSFYSREELGTEFVLTFPRPKENPWKARERGELGPVLIFDKQANYRRTLLAKFKVIGFKAEGFSNYNDGLEKINSMNIHPSGVMVDVQPGNAEDLAFIRKLRQCLGPKGLIFTISHFPSTRDIKEDLKAAGATDCFEKPIHADGFDFILKLLDNSGFAAQDKSVS